MTFLLFQRASRMFLFINRLRLQNIFMVKLFLPPFVFNKSAKTSNDL